MRRKIVIAIIIVVCFLLQCTVFKELAIASVSPNLMIVVTAAFGFMRGKREGLFVGFFCGVLVDLMFGNVLGVFALLYMLVGYLNGYFKGSFFPDAVKLPIFLIALSDFGCNIVIYVVMFLLRARFSFGYYLSHIIMAELVYTMLIAIVLYFILLRINQWMEEIEKRSAKKFV